MLLHVSRLERFVFFLCSDRVETSRHYLSYYYMYIISIVSRYLAITNIDRSWMKRRMRIESKKVKFSSKENSLDLPISIRVFVRITRQFPYYKKKKEKRKKTVRQGITKNRVASNSRLKSPSLPRFGRIEKRRWKIPSRIRRESILVPQTFRRNGTGSWFHVLT